MAGVAEGDVSRAALDALLAQGAEGRDVDFKREMDISKKRDLIELAKDVAAMSMYGGHIVIGIEDDGAPSNLVDATAHATWDEARVVPQLQKWLPETIDVRIAVHDTELHGRLILVAVAPHRDGLAVIKSVANYQEEDGKQTAVLREGDILARHGTRSERATQSDIHDAITRVVESSRESQRQETMGQLLAQQARALTADAVATTGVAQVTWSLPVETLCGVAIDLLRRKDRIPLEYLKVSAGAQISAVLTGATNDVTLGELLDRFAAMAATGAVANDHLLFQQSIGHLAQTYRRTMSGSGERLTGLTLSPAGVWLQVLQRVEAIGGLLTRLEQWERVRELALGHGSLPSQEFYRNWLRHGVTWAARDGVKVEVSDEAESLRGLVAGGRDVAIRIPELRPDVLDTDDALLDSICQFDALAALVAMRAGGDVDGRHYYPNFAAYPPMRTEPIFEQLVERDGMKAQLGFNNDEALAVVLTQLLRTASSEGSRNMQWWMVDRLPVNAWLNEHGPK